MDAEQYIKHWEKNKVWTHLAWAKHQRRLELCAKYIAQRPAPKTGHFADVGCAYGHSTEIMRKFIQGTWTGIDFSQTAIAMAKKFFPTGEWVYVKDIALAGPLGPFDGTVCSEVLEHVPDDKGFFKGLQAITDGRIVLTTPTKKVSDPGHLRIYTEASLEALLAGTRHFIVQDEQFFYAVVDQP